MWVVASRTSLTAYGVVGFYSDFYLSSVSIRLDTISAYLKSAFLNNKKVITQVMKFDSSYHSCFVQNTFSVIVKNVL